MAKQWSYEGELIGQSGNRAGDALTAWATTIQIQRKLKLPWHPSLLGEYNFASGDRQQRDGKSNTFDQLYPTNHGIYGIADQVGRRNTENVRYGVWLRPEKWLTIKTEGHHFWLASRYDALYTFNGNVSVPAVSGGASDRSVGSEVDLIADIKLSPHYDVGAQFGHLFPGPYLRTYTPGGGRTFYAFFVDFRI